MRGVCLSSSGVRACSSWRAPTALLRSCCRRILGGWCAGFLYALGLAGEDSYGRLSSEAREFVRDLTEISRIDAGVEGDEQEEAAYTEVLEYVRVGVLMVYEDLRQSRQPPGADRLH